MADIFELFKQIGQTESARTPVEYIVAGLGNPGKEYTFTRHNAGFLTMDYLAQKENVKIDRLKYQALTAEATIRGKRVLLMKPQTFMNLSGDAIGEAAAFYKIPPEKVIVICDDLNFEPGKMRIRKKGSAGGHNGLKSIIARLGSDAFPRIKLGIGNKPHPDYDLADWVLSAFTEDEQKKLFEAFGSACEAIGDILEGKIDAAMGKFN